MAIQAQLLQEGETLDFTAEVALVAGDVIQMADGRAGVVTNDVAAGALGSAFVCGVFKVLKTATMVLLKGGRAFWDYSATKVYFRKVNDRDFYMGRCTEDATSAATTCTVALNERPGYDIDIALDPFASTIIGTATTQLLNRRGGSHDIVIAATSEAAKIDLLALDGFDIAANAIVEFAFCVPNDGAGTVVDINVGVASATHATDADSIAKYCFMHLDANNTAIQFQSKDGTTTVAATDSTKTYTEGQTSAAGVRKEVWMDFRDPTDVQIYVDAVLVLGATVFNMAAATTLYPLCHVEKTSSTDAYELQLDWLRTRFAKQ